ncbi:alcohol dehydrogenase catalytic domain-containing protein [Streptomyces sp. NPDC087300]|uniref:alcohol dehydrogenase catalytic domain-containing protein n=1 Tax=Streptomyces sp. NPDC087300 TaxID=3365780 RepID=UPI0037FEB09B
MPTMQAVLLTAYGSPLAAWDHPLPPVPPHGALVQVRACGLCGTDLHLAAGELAPLFPLPEFPWVLGHEVAGVVAELGPDARPPADVAEGSPVAVYGPGGCGDCARCTTGHQQLCPGAGGWLGVGRAGGFAEYVAVSDARHLLPLKGLPAEQAAPLTDAGLTAYHAVRRALPALASRGPRGAVVVIGLGGVGSFAVQLARLLAPAMVVSCVRRPAELADHARRLGADALAGLADGPGCLRDLAPGGEVDAVIDTVGTAESMKLAAAVLRPSGRCLVVGAKGGTVSLGVGSPDVPFETELSTSVWGGLTELHDLLQLAHAGRLDLGHVRRYPLADAARAAADLKAGRIRGRAVLCP